MNSRTLEVMFKIRFVDISSGRKGFLDMKKSPETKIDYFIPKYYFEMTG